METKRITIELDEQTQKSIEEILAQDIHVTLKTAQAAIMRLATNEYARLLREPSSSIATKADIQRSEKVITDAIASIKIKASRAAEAEPVTASGAGGYVKKADRKATLEEEGAERCKRMGGSMQGNTCVYKKYEVTAGGMAVDYVMSSPLASLTQEDEDKQYDPDRAFWEKVKSEEK
jgi:hypothetical protein